MLNLHDYYRRPAVRQRMVEFLGGLPLEDTTCVYLTADGRGPTIDYRPRPPAELWSCLDQGLEVKRSLWDRRSLIVHVDIEHVNSCDR
jgi:hypothetical protein